MKRLIIWCVLGLIMMMMGCRALSSMQPSSGQPQHKQDDPFIVFAASSLMESFQEVADAFTEKTGVAVTLSFAGTQRLRTQIEQGAPADIFASANVGHMKALRQEGYVSRYYHFVKNRLTLIVPANNPAHIKQLNDLDQADVSLIIGAENVPVGQYARKMLSHADAVYGHHFKDKVMTNVVSMALNTKKVATKVALGEVDAGIVYVTDVTPDLRDDVKTITIPTKINVMTTDTIAKVKSTNQPHIAKQWLTFVMSEKGQNILRSHGMVSYPQSLPFQAD